MNVIKLFSATIIGVFLLLANVVQADIREVYMCNFLDGKDMNDMLSARDYYLKQAKKSGIATPTAFVWTPYKGNSSADLLWFNNHKNMMEFAKQADEFNGSTAMASAITRFNSVVKCNSILASRDTMFEGGEPPVATPPAIISSNACMFKGNILPADISDFKQHVGEVLGSIPAYKNAVLYASSPLTPANNSADLYLYSVHENLSSWASKRVAFEASKGAAALGRHFQSMLDCTTSLWIGQRVVPKQ